MRVKRMLLLVFIVLLCASLTACADLPTETGFRVDTTEMTLELTKGTEADFTKLKVEAVFSDETTKTLSEGENGYRLDLGGFEKNTVGEYTVTVTYKTYPAQTFVIKVKEPAAPPIETPSVTGIEIKTAPTKTVYENGEELDLTGLSVEKVMSDGAKTLLTQEDYIVDSSAYNKAVAGTYAIVVKYKADETKTATFTVTVKAPIPTVTGITVTTTGVKLEYEIGEELDLNGLAVKKKMSDDSEVSLEATEYIVDSSAYDKAVAGTYAIVVKYKADETKTATFNVTVKAPLPTVTGIMVMTTGVKLEYEIGEELDLNGLTVKKQMSDDSEVPLEATEYLVDSSAYNKTAAGTYAIVVKYKADETKTATFTVTVKAPLPTVTGIAVTTTGVKLEYEIGEELNLNGLAVKKKMSDNSEVPLEAAEYTVDSSAYNKTAAGTYAIVVKYKADETKTATFTVTVKEAAVSYRIKTMPRTAFLEGENFNAFGLEVERVDAAGTTTLAADEYIVDYGAYTAAVGKYDIFINVIAPANGPKNASAATGAAASLKYTVSVSAVQMNLEGVKRNYREGEKLDTTNLTLSLVDADGKPQPLTEGADYAVDRNSYNAWIDQWNGDNSNRKIQIRLTQFPDFPISYQYFVDPAALRSAEIDWKRTSTVLPYGYAYQEKPVDGAENVGVFFSGIDVHGKPSKYGAGRYEYLNPYDGYGGYTVEWDKPLDTTVPGTYLLTLGVRVKAEDEPIMLLPAIAVTVLAENAPYVIGASSDLSEVDLAFGSAIDYSKIPVTLRMSDGTTRQTTLNETDWIIEAEKQSPNYYRFEPKNAYRTRDTQFDGNFMIRWTDGTNVVTDRYLIEVTDWETRYPIRDVGNNSYEAYLKLNGVYTSTIRYADGRENKIFIETINGAAYNDQSPYWVSESEFRFDGTEMTIGWKEQNKDNQEGTLDCTLKILPAPNFIRPDTYFELEIDGVKQTPSYSWSDELVRNDYALEGNAAARVTYVIPFEKTALPIRFLLKRDDFRLYYRNDTGNRGSEGMETVYYYQSATNPKDMTIMFSVTSLETGNLMLQGSIRFLMETMVTSMSYAVTPEEETMGYGLEQYPPEPHITVRTASAPSLSKFNLALKDGFRYRFRDDLGEITTDAQLLQFLESGQSGISLEILSDDGVVYEEFHVSFDIMPISTGGPVQNYGEYYYDAEGLERVDFPHIRFNGRRLTDYDYITSGMLGGTWTLFEDVYQREITEGVQFKFFDRDGKEVDLAALNVLSGMYYVRASFAAYGMLRSWDEMGQEVVSFEPVTRYETLWFRYSSIEARPSEYIECFHFAPVPENMASDVSRFDYQISAFRTDTVTKESFGVRYKPEYRDTMTMVVEDAGKDRFVAKFYLGERLVTFLNVTVTREGVVDADTSADFTYQNLSDGNLSFVMFRGGEAYLTLQAGSFFNIVPRNDYAMVTMEASDPDAATEFFGRFGERQVLLNKAGSYTLRLTVTSTDETAAENYVLYLRVTEEPPMFTLTAAGTEYRAFLSELFGGAAGDFTLRDDLGSVVLLSEPLKASELGSLYDAAAKTLKLTISAPAPSEIFETDQNFRPTVPVGSGEEHAYPLTDVSQLSQEFSGMLGTTLMIANEASGQYIPVLIVVNPAL